MYLHRSSMYVKWHYLLIKINTESGWGQNRITWCLGSAWKVHLSLSWPQSKSWRASSWRNSRRQVRSSTNHWAMAMLAKKRRSKILWLITKESSNCSCLVCIDQALAGRDAKVLFCDSRELTAHFSVINPIKFYVNKSRRKVIFLILLTVVRKWPCILISSCSPV